MEKKILFLTGNPGKLAEASALINEKGFELLSFSAEIPEVQTHSIEESVRHKLDQTLQLPSLPPSDYVLVDDVALEFQAMGGFPGIYVKWLLRSMPLEEIHSLIAPSSLKALAVCCLGLRCRKTLETRFFKGTLKGSVVPPAGKKGFGWDPLFKPEGHTLTFAEMEPEQKNRISHRSLAIARLVDHLAKIP